MNNTQKRIRFIQKFAVLTAIAKAYGIDFIIATFYRSPEEQRKKFEEGKSQRDGYTLKSAHQKWLAIDLYIVKNGKVINKRTSEYEKLGEIWKGLDGIWGGDFKSFDDVFHFEYGE